MNFRALCTFLFFSSTLNSFSSVHGDLSSWENDPAVLQALDLHSRAVLFSYTKNNGSKEVFFQEKGGSDIVLLMDHNMGEDQDEVLNSISVWLQSVEASKLAEAGREFKVPELFVHIIKNPDELKLTDLGFRKLQRDQLPRNYPVGRCQNSINPMVISLCSMIDLILDSVQEPEKAAEQFLIRESAKNEVLGLFALHPLKDWAGDMLLEKSENDVIHYVIVTPEREDLPCQNTGTKSISESGRDFFDRALAMNVNHLKTQGLPISLEVSFLPVKDSGGERAIDELIHLGYKRRAPIEPPEYNSIVKDRCQSKLRQFLPQDFQPLFDLLCDPLLADHSGH